MRKLIQIGVATVLGCLCLGGCARPFEVGWTPAYDADERWNMILRNWDYEGKQAMDDLDHALLLRPSSRLSIWHVR